MKRIPLSRGWHALVDDDDYEWLNQWKWYATQDGYAVRDGLSIDNKKRQVRMHRLILGIDNASPGVETDHINRKPWDNRRANLRIANSSQNKSNRHGKNLYKGVDWSTAACKWRVRVGEEHIGVFADIEIAARVYDVVANDKYGEYAHLNFPKTLDESYAIYSSLAPKKECPRIPDWKKAEIKRVREECGFSYRQLGREFGIDKMTAHRIYTTERG